jgi:hypothetical protein
VDPELDTPIKAGLPEPIIVKKEMLHIQGNITIPMN